MTLGELIAGIRKQQGLTQAALAQKAGVSTSAVAMYETNRRQPEDATLKILADALGVSVETLSPAASSLSAAAAAGEIKSTLPVTTPTSRDAASTAPKELKSDPGWTNLTLSRDEARFILFMRMHPDTQTFLLDYMTADAQKRKQIEKAMRLIQAFQS